MSEVINSKSFFANTDCEYYPCHKCDEPVNCLFCYCPLYQFDTCPGKYKMIERDGKVIKSCIDCDFPHRKDNYEKVIAILKNKLH